MHHRLKKISAVVCSAAMLTAGIPAAAAAEPTPRVLAMASNFPTDLAELEIPQTLGTIEEAFLTGGDRTVILIQDAHAVPEAQNSIRKLIHYFQKEYGVAAVASEGSAGPLDIFFLRKFPNQELLKKTMRAYHQRAELSGVSAAALFDTNLSSRYYGIEDWSLYQDGIRYYQQALRQESEVTARLIKQRAELDLKKKSLYPPQLLDFDRSLYEFQFRGEDLAQTLKAANAMIPAPRGSAVEALLLQIHAADTADEKLRHITQKAIQAFRKNMASLHKTMPPDLNYSIQAFETGEMTAPAVALVLRRAARKEKIRVSFAPELTRQIQMHQKISRIKGTKLYEDLQGYFQKVKASMLTTPEQVNIDKQSHALDVLEKLAKLELTREEWEELKSWKLEVGSGKNQKTNNRGFLSAYKKADKGLTHGLANARSDSPLLPTSNFQLLTLPQDHFSFYENAEKREEAFLDQLNQLLDKSKPAAVSFNPALVSENASATVVFVAGGFHSHGLARLLREQNIRYLLLTPKIKALPEKSAYREQMMGDVSWKSYFQVERGRVNLGDAFSRAVRDDLLSEKTHQTSVYNDSRSTIHNPRLLKAWRDDLIRGLADERRLGDAGHYTRFLDEAAGAKSSSGSLNSLSKPFFIGRLTQFIEGLKNLDQTKQLTEFNLFQLLKAHAPTLQPKGELQTKAGLFGANTAQVPAVGSQFAPLAELDAAFLGLSSRQPRSGSEAPKPKQRSELRTMIENGKLTTSAPEGLLEALSRQAVRFKLENDGLWIIPSDKTEFSPSERAPLTYADHGNFADVYVYPDYHGAVKIMREATSADESHVLHEINVLRELSDPFSDLIEQKRLPQIVAKGKTSGRFYLVTDAPKNARDLDRLREEMSLGFERRVDILISAASTLEALNTGGWLHRDVKLPNIIVGDKGWGGVQIIDFGLSGLMKETEPDEQKIDLERFNDLAVSFLVHTHDTPVSREQIGRLKVQKTWPGVLTFLASLKRRSEVRIGTDAAALSEVLGQYGIEKAKTTLFDPEKENVWLVTASEKKWVLKTPLYRTTGALIDWEASVLEKLGERAAQIYKTDAGGNYVRAKDGRLYVLYENIEGKEYGWGEVEEENLDTAARWLARMHHDLRGAVLAGTPYTANQRPRLLSMLHLETGLKKLETFLESQQPRGPPRGFSQADVNLIRQQIARLRAQLDPPVAAALPKTITHGDFHQGNMRFQPSGAIRVFDFEYAAEDVRVRDLANALTIRYGLDGSSISLRKISRFIEAYHRENPLSENEIRVLPEVFRLSYLEGVWLFGAVHGDQPWAVNSLREQLLNLERLDAQPWANLQQSLLKGLRSEVRVRPEDTSESLDPFAEYRFSVPENFNLASVSISRNQVGQYIPQLPIAFKALKKQGLNVRAFGGAVRALAFATRFHFPLPISELDFAVPFEVIMGDQFDQYEAALKDYEGLLNDQRRRVRYELDPLIWHPTDEKSFSVILNQKEWSLSKFWAEFDEQRQAFVLQGDQQWFEDVENKRLRIVGENEFSDPERIPRMLKLAHQLQRFGFQIEPESLRLFETEIQREVYVSGRHQWIRQKALELIDEIKNEQLVQHPETDLEKSQKLLDQNKQRQNELLSWAFSPTPQADRAKLEPVLAQHLEIRKNSVAEAVFSHEDEGGRYIVYVHQSQPWALKAPKRFAVQGDLEQDLLDAEQGGRDLFAPFFTLTAAEARQLQPLLQEDIAVDSEGGWIVQQAAYSLYAIVGELLQSWGATDDSRVKENIEERLKLIFTEWKRLVYRSWALGYVMSDYSLESVGIMNDGQMRFTGESFDHRWTRFYIGAESAAELINNANRQWLQTMFGSAESVDRVYGAGLRTSDFDLVWPVHAEIEEEEKPAAYEKRKSIFETSETKQAFVEKFQQDIGITLQRSEVRTRPDETVRQTADTQEKLRLKDQGIADLVRIELAPLLSESGRVLEIGTGLNGALTRILAQAKQGKGVSFVATDLDAEAAEAAAKQLADLKNVDVRIGDLFAPVPGEKFDTIFWNPPWYSEERPGKRNGLAYLDPNYSALKRYLREAPNFLTPQGQFFVILPRELSAVLWEDAQVLGLNLEEISARKTRRFNVALFALKPITTKQRSEASRSEVRAPLQSLSDLFRRAGVPLRDWERTEQGFHVSTQRLHFTEMVSAFPESNENPFTVFDAGSGQGVFAFRLDAARSNAKIMGVESDARLFGDSQKVLARALEEGLIESDQVRFFQDDFNSTASREKISKADYVYYYDSGTRRPLALAQTLIESMLPGAQLVILAAPSGSPMAEDLEQSGFFDEQPVLGAIWTHVLRRNDRLFTRSEVRAHALSELDLAPQYRKILAGFRQAGVSDEGIARMESVIAGILEHQPPFVLRQGKPLLNLFRIFDPALDGRVTRFVSTTGSVYALLSEAFSKKGKAFYEHDNLTALYFASQIADKKMASGEPRYDLLSIGHKIKSAEAGGAVPDAMLYDRELGIYLIAEFRAGYGNLSKLLREKNRQTLNYLRLLLNADLEAPVASDDILLPQHVLGQNPAGFLWAVDQSFTKGEEGEGWSVEGAARNRLQAMLDEAKEELERDHVPVRNDFNPDDLKIEFLDQRALYHHDGTLPDVSNALALKPEDWTKVSETLDSLYDTPGFSGFSGMMNSDLYGLAKKLNWQRSDGSELSLEEIYNRYYALGDTLEERLGKISKLTSTARSEVRADLDAKAQLDKVYELGREKLLNFIWPADYSGLKWDKDYGARLTLDKALLIYERAVREYAEGRYQNKTPDQLYGNLSEWSDLLANIVNASNATIEIIEDGDLSDVVERSAKIFDYSEKMEALKFLLDTLNSKSSAKSEMRAAQSEGAVRSEVRSQAREEAINAFWRDFADGKIAVKNAAAEAKRHLTAYGLDEVAVIDMDRLNIGALREDSGFELRADVLFSLFSPTKPILRRHSSYYPKDLVFIALENVVQHSKSGGVVLSFALDDKHSQVVIINDGAPMDFAAWKSDPTYSVGTGDRHTALREHVEPSQIKAGRSSFSMRSGGFQYDFMGGAPQPIQTPATGAITTINSYTARSETRRVFQAKTHLSGTRQAARSEMRTENSLEAQFGTEAEAIRHFLGWENLTKETEVHPTTTRENGRGTRTRHVTQYKESGGQIFYAAEYISDQNQDSPAELLGVLQREETIQNLAAQAGVSPPAKIFETPRGPVMIQQAWLGRPIMGLRHEKEVRAFGHALGLLHHQGIRHGDLIYGRGYIRENNILLDEIRKDEPRIGLIDFEFSKMNQSPAELQGEKRQVRFALYRFYGLSEDILKEFDAAYEQALTGSADLSTRSEMRRERSFLHQGPLTKASFDSLRSAFERKDVTSLFRDRLIEVLTAEAGSYFQEERQALFLRKLEKMKRSDFKIYSIPPHSLGSGDYLEGLYDEEHRKLYVSEDYLSFLEGKGPEVDHYERRLLHEIMYPARKVLVLGASGFIGGEIHNELSRFYPDVVGTAHTQKTEGELTRVDVTREADVLKLIEREKPDVIVYAAGIADIQTAEKDKDRARLLNTGVPEMLAREFKGQLIYLSTDYVFDGQKTPYEPSAAPAPLNFYGQTKARGEQAVLAKPKNTVVRFGMAFGAYEAAPRDFIQQLVMHMEGFKQGDAPLVLDDSQIRHPVWTADIAQLVVDAVNEKQAGVLQINGEEGMTKFQFAQAVEKAYREAAARDRKSPELAEGPFWISAATSQQAATMRPQNAQMVNSVVPTPFSRAIDSMVSRYEDLTLTHFYKALLAGDAKTFNRLATALTRRGVHWVITGNPEEMSEWQGEKPVVYGYDRRPEIHAILKKDLDMTTASRIRIDRVIDAGVLNSPESELQILVSRQVQRYEAEPTFELSALSNSHNANVLTYLLLHGYSESMNAGAGMRKVWVPMKEGEGRKGGAKKLQGGSFSSVYRMTRPDGNTLIEKRAKTIEDGGKLLAEARYMQRLQESGDSAGRWFPRIFLIREESGETIVQMEDIPWPNLTYVVQISFAENAYSWMTGAAHRVISKKTQMQVLQNIYRMMTPDFYAQVQSPTPPDFVERYHFKKVEERWRDAAKKSEFVRELLEAPYLEFADEPHPLMPNLQLMLNTLRLIAKAHPEPFTPPYLSKQHGDLHEGNILIDPFDFVAHGEIRNLKLIDPKYMPEGNDPLYDFAKLLHNYFGHYDLALEHSKTFHFNIQMPGAKNKPAVFSSYFDDDAMGTEMTLSRIAMFNKEVVQFLGSPESDRLFPFEKDPIAWRMRLLFTHATLIAGLLPFHTVGDQHEAKVGILYQRSAQLFHMILNGFHAQGLMKDIPGLQKAWGALDKAHEKNKRPAFEKALKQIEAVVTDSTRSEVRIGEQPDQVGFLMNQRVRELLDALKTDLIGNQENAAKQYVDVLELLFEIGALKGNLVYPGAGVDVFPALFAQHLAALDSVIPETGLSVGGQENDLLELFGLNLGGAVGNEFAKMMPLPADSKGRVDDAGELLQSLSWKLSEERRERAKTARPQILRVDHYQTNDYFPQLREVFGGRDRPVNALLIKGLHYGIDQGFLQPGTHEAEEERRKAQELIRDYDRDIMAEEGFVILMGQQELYLADFLAGLGYRDYLAALKQPEIQETLAVDAPVTISHVDRAHDHFTSLRVGRLPVRVFKRMKGDIALPEGLRSEVRSQESASSGLKDESPVANILREQIQAKGGAITFRDFMETSLYEPRHGYYTSGQVSLGGHDAFHDFSTYVESSSEPFAEGLLNHMLVMWEKLGQPKNLQVVEMGAGQGVLASNILKMAKTALTQLASKGTLDAESKKLQRFLKSLDYVIVEISEDLKKRQQAAVASVLTQPVISEDRMSDDQVSVQWAPFAAHQMTGSAMAGKTNPLTASMARIFISNELPDAFPVHRVKARIAESGLFEYKEAFVTVDASGRFIEIWKPLESLNALRIEMAIQAMGKVYEKRLRAGGEVAVNLQALQWQGRLADLLNRSSKDRGYIVTIDYGYPGEQYIPDNKMSVRSYAKGRPFIFFGVRIRNPVLLQNIHLAMGVMDRVIKLFPELLMRLLYRLNPMNLFEPDNQYIYEKPGYTDITSDVDFSMLDNLGERSGLATEALVSQGHFFALAGVSPEKVNQLDHPGFFALVQSKGVKQALFDNQNPLPPVWEQLKPETKRSEVRSVAEGTEIINSEWTQAQVAEAFSAFVPAEKIQRDGSIYPADFDNAENGEEKPYLDYGLSMPEMESERLRTLSSLSGDAFWQEVVKQSFAQGALPASWDEAPFIPQLLDPLILKLPSEIQGMNSMFYYSRMLDEKGAAFPVLIKTASGRDFSEQALVDEALVDFLLKRLGLSAVLGVVNLKDKQSGAIKKGIVYKIIPAVGQEENATLMPRRILLMKFEWMPEMLRTRLGAAFYDMGNSVNSPEGQAVLYQAIANYNRAFHSDSQTRSEALREEGLQRAMQRITESLNEFLKRKSGTRQPTETLKDVMLMSLFMKQKNTDEFTSSDQQRFINDFFSLATALEESKSQRERLVQEAVERINLVFKRQGRMLFYGSLLADRNELAFHLINWAGVQRQAADIANQLTLRVPGQLHSILVAEDLLIPEYEFWAKELQEKWGIELVVKPNGREGLEELTQNASGYDLIISDVNMPEMTGPEMMNAFSNLSERNHEVPAIYVTDVNLEALQPQRDPGRDYAYPPVQNWTNRAHLEKTAAYFDAYTLPVLTEVIRLLRSRSEMRISKKHEDPEALANSYREAGYYETLRRFGLKTLTYFNLMRGYVAENSANRLDFFALNYDEAAYLIANPDLRKPHGVSDSPTTAKHLVWAALDTIPGFREAREAGNIKSMAQLYRTHVLSYAPNGQIGFFYKKSKLAALMKPREYADLTKPAALLDLALPNLVNDDDPTALRRYEVEDGIWNEPAYAKKYILKTLDTIPGFAEARTEKNIKKMADLYRAHVIDYVPIDTTKYSHMGQTSFFYERGGLKGLMINPRSFLEKADSAAALLRFALADIDLIDDDNPDALKRYEVENGMWNDPKYAKKSILRALDTIPGFFQARKRKDIKRMAELYRRHVINYPLVDGKAYTNGRQAAFFRRHGLSGLMEVHAFIEKGDSGAELLRHAFPDIRLIDDSNPDALSRKEIEQISRSEMRTPGDSFNLDLPLIETVEAARIAERLPGMKVRSEVRAEGGAPGTSVLRTKLWPASYHPELESSAVLAKLASEKYDEARREQNEVAVLWAGDMAMQVLGKMIEEKNLAELMLIQEPLERFVELGADRTGAMQKLVVSAFSESKNTVPDFDALLALWREFILLNERTEISVRIIRHEGGAYDFNSNFQNAGLSIARLKNDEIENAWDKFIKPTREIQQSVQDRITQRKTQQGEVYPKTAPILSFAEAAVWRQLLLDLKDFHTRDAYKALMDENKDKVGNYWYFAAYSVPMFLELIEGSPMLSETALMDVLWRAMSGAAGDVLRVPVPYVDSNLPFGEKAALREEYVESLREQGVEFDLKISPEAKVYVEPLLFSQALRTLIKNSLQVASERLGDENEERRLNPALAGQAPLSRKDRPVKFRIQYDGSTLDVIELVDNVGGIAQKDSEFLEETYPGSGRQKLMILNNSRRKNDTGFGLAFVWHVIHMHGGAFALENTEVEGSLGPQRGLRVTIQLPKKESAASDEGQDSSETRSEVRARLAPAAGRPQAARDEQRATRGEHSATEAAAGFVTALELGDLTRSEVRQAVLATIKIGAEPVVAELERIRDELNARGARGERILVAGQTVDAALVQARVQSMIDVLTQKLAGDVSTGHAVTYLMPEDDAEVLNMARVIEKFASGLTQVILKKEAGQRVPPVFLDKMKELGIRVGFVSSLAKAPTLLTDQVYSGLVGSDALVPEQGLAEAFVPVVETQGASSSTDPLIRELELALQTAIALLVAEKIRKVSDKSTLHAQAVALLKDYELFEGFESRVLVPREGGITISGSAIESFLASWAALQKVQIAA